MGQTYTHFYTYGTCVPLPMALYITVLFMLHEVCKGKKNTLCVKRDGGRLLTFGMLISESVWIDTFVDMEGYVFREAA